MCPNLPDFRIHPTLPYKPLFMRFRYCKHFPYRNIWSPALTCGSRATSCGSRAAITCSYEVYSMQISILALSSGFVVASSCGYIAAIKSEAVFTLMNMCICIDVGIKLIFKIHLFKIFFI